MRYLVAVCGLVTLLWTGPAAGQTVRTWQNAVSDNFAVSTRWSPIGKPTGTDTARFNQAGTYSINFTANESFGPLTVEAGTVDWISSAARTVGVDSINVAIANTALRIKNTVFVTSAGVTTINTSGGSLTLDGGRLTSSTLQVSLGALQVLDAASILTVSGACNIGGQGLTGAVTMSAGSATFDNTVNLAPGGSGAFSTGQITLSGAATSTMNGNLNVGTITDNDRQGIISVTGSGTQLTQTGGHTMTIGRVLTVLPLGDVSSRIDVGSGGVINSGTGAINLQSFGHLNVNAGGTFNANGGLTIQSNGQLNVNGGNYNAISTTTIQSGGAAVVGAGGILNAADNVQVQGSLSADLGTVNVNSGSVLTVPVGGQFSTGSTQVNGGQVLVSGGNFNLVAGNGLVLLNNALANLGPFTLNSGASVTVNNGTELRLASLVAGGGSVNFFGGLVNFTGNTTLSGSQINALLGSSASLLGGRTLQVQGIATLQSQLTVDGGTLNVNSLVGGTLLDLQRGTLNLTQSNLVVGAAGAFGSTLSIVPGATINVQGSNNTTVNAGALLTMTGGQLNSGGGLTNNGTISLDNAAATLAGGAVSNSGLLRGEGLVTANFSNNAAGEVRAETGKWLKFQGINGANAGRINLLGGTAEFSQPYTNGANGQILGRGTLIVGGIGLTNNGQLIFSNDATSIFGDVNNNTGNVTKGITISGNAGVTFWDDVTHAAGSLFKVQTGSSATFFGTFGGAGSLTGGGDVYFEADLTPGSSPASVSYDNNVHLGPGSVTKIELGGNAPGAQFDQIHVSQQLSLGGTLQVSLISGFTPALGNTFDILDFGTLSGGFSSIQLPALSASLAWNTSQLFSTGVLSVVSSNLVPGDFNRDGHVNAADIPTMLAALSDLNSYKSTNSLSDPQLLSIGDINLSGDITNADVQALIGLLKNGGGSLASVPEPAGFLLMALAGIALPIAGLACSPRRLRQSAFR